MARPPTKSRLTQTAQGPLPFSSQNLPAFAVTCKSGWFCWLETTWLKQHLLGHLTQEWEKVKVVSVYFYLDRKTEGQSWRSISAEEKQSWWTMTELLFQGCFTGGWGTKCFSGCRDLRNEEQGLQVPAPCFWHSPFRAEVPGANSYQAQSSNSRIFLSFERVTGADRLSPASLDHIPALATVWWMSLSPRRQGGALPFHYYPGSILWLTF